MLHIPLGREYVTGIPSMETEFKFNMVVCFWHTFDTVCCFPTRIYLQHIARPFESDRPIKAVFVRPSFHPSFRPSVRPSVVRL